MEALEYLCPSCSKSVQALKQTKFASLPEVLVVHAKKFQLVNWVPAKLDIPVILPPDDELVFTERHLGRGLQPNETELPNENLAPSLPQFNEAAMAQLEGMGFPTIRCQKALLATGNDNPEAAMEWLFGHMEDADIDDIIQVSYRLLPQTANYQLLPPKTARRGKKFPLILARIHIGAVSPLPFAQLRC